jgi:hypothetical protein
MSRNRKPERCRDWPSCGCARRWQRWEQFAANIDECPPLSDEQVEASLADIVFLLSCVAQFCPDASKREHAALQLMRPIFAKEARQWWN